MRTICLQELAARQAEAESSNATSRYTTLIHEEEKRWSHRCIKLATGNNVMGGVTAIEDKLNPNADD